MKNKIYYCTFFICLSISFLLIGCDDSQESVFSPDKDEYLKKEDDSGIEDNLQNDENLQELIDVWYGMNQHILQYIDENDISVKELEQAYIDGDEEKIRKLTGYTTDEIYKIQTRLEKAAYALLHTYPELEDYINDQGVCYDSKCLENFFQNYQLFDDHSMPAPLGDVSCAWIPYAASLVGCTALGPYLYWPCAVVATCHWCEGGWVNNMCEIE